MRYTILEKYRENNALRKHKTKLAINVYKRNYRKNKSHIYSTLKRQIQKCQYKITNEECRYCFTQIIKQYSELCANSNLKLKDSKSQINYKPMADWIVESHKFLSTHKKYQDLMVDINQLAEMWDRARLSCNTSLQCEDFKIRHRFFFSTNLPGIKSKPTYASFYNPSESPDDRVILIVIDETISLKQNYEEILHEVGHYIGCRIRVSRNNSDKDHNRQAIGRHMIALEWINTLHMYMCAEILNEDVDLSYRNMRGDLTINIDKRKAMHTMLFSLCSDTYYKQLCSFIDEGCEELQKKNIKSLYHTLYPQEEERAPLRTPDDIIEYAKVTLPEDIINPKMHELRKELICIKCGYLDTEIKRIIDVFLLLLSDKKRQHDFEFAFWKGCPVQSADRMTKIYRTAFSHIEKSTLAFISGKKSVEEITSQEKRIAFHWIYQPQNLLEEIAADTFLCNFGGVQETYLDSILRGYALQETNTEILTKKLAVEIINNDSYRHRLLALTAALNLVAPHNDPRAYIGQIENIFVNLAKKISIMSSMYNNEEDSMQRAMINMFYSENPAILASQYASMILNDKRYLSFLQSEDNSKLIQQLRGYNC